MGRFLFTAMMPLVLLSPSARAAEPTDWFHQAHWGVMTQCAAATRDVARGESQTRIKAFCIDFNWGPKGINGFAGPGVWADASPEEHVRWYDGLGANVIQTFAVSCNGYAWYKGGIVPPQPGLKHDFLTDVVRLGHAKGMRVMGYYCVGANTLWGQKHPDLSYGTPGAPHIPLTTAYLDYLCGSMEDALKRTGMDGFMIDWVWNPSERTRSPGKKAREQWLECERTMYRELVGQPFPGEDHLNPSDKLAYERRALDRCWTRIHAAAKRANPNCVIWLSCNDLKHPTVTDSKMFREIDWLMNEHPDPASIAAVAKMAGPHTQLVQCLVGWGDQHDAKKVLENPEFRKLGIYGFAKPGENSMPLPIAEYRGKSVGAFKGNDKNIAVLLRYFHGLPLDYIEHSRNPGSQSRSPSALGSAGGAPCMALESSQVNVLMADRAKRTGTLNVTVWGKPEGRAWVEKWQQPEEFFQWLVDLSEAGRYEVSVLAEGRAQAEAEIASDVGRLTFRLPKGWDKLTLSDPLTIPKGRSTITLRLLKPDNATLKSLELINLAAREDIQRRIERLRASTRWLRDAKYGIMFQWGGWGYPQHGPKKPWPKMIDDFDVEAFAHMAEDTGAGYVIWSVTWCSYHFPAPIKAIDRIAPGHTSQRDLVGDLADALAKRNIKLLLYYHEGHPDKDWWPKNWDYADPDRKEKFVNNLCDVMTEVGQRYGPKVAGWFLDDGMLFYPAPFEHITKALKAGNPDRLVSYNSWILPRLTEFQEVYMGEGFAGSADTPVGSDGIFPAGPQKGLFAHGMFVLDGPDWGINGPDIKINQPAFSAERAVGLVRRAAERGQTLSFNLLMYEDGSVSPTSLEVLRAVRKAIRGK